MDPSLLKKMPVISGISIGFLEKEGRKIDSKNLKLALSLLSEIKRSRFARDYAIASIDASDAANLSFYLANGLEIRIGCEQFRERLNKLRKVLKDPRLATDRIKYIDLRFEGASIAPK
jgi:cell division septal protein FtsQ